jgi:hypothetical protein
MREKIFIALCAIGFIVILGIVGRMDYEDEMREQVAYCEMRQIWENDAARGVPAADRAGWPPFKPEIEHQCGW